jgi:anthranilate synthase
MNRTVFSIPDISEYRTASGLAITRVSEQFSGDAKRLDDLRPLREL